MSLIVVVVAAIFALRGGNSEKKLDTVQIQVWRAQVEQCLQSNDPSCAEQSLSLLRTGAPTEYWSDLQQSTHELRQRLISQEQKATDDARAKASREARESEQRAVQQAQAEQAKIASTATAIPPPEPASSLGVNSPVRVDRASQQRNPPRYLADTVREFGNSSVLLDIDVDSTGLPTRVTIARSSGSRILDRSAREAAQRWRYEPAVVNGQATIGSLRQQVDFTIEQGSESAAMPDNRRSGEASDPGLISKARRELMAGRYDVALALAESALQANPSSQEARDLVQQARAERSRVMRETTID